MSLRIGRTVDLELMPMVGTVSERVHAKVALAFPTHWICLGEGRSRIFGGGRTRTVVPREYDPC